MLLPLNSYDVTGLLSHETLTVGDSALCWTIKATVSHYRVSRHSLLVSVKEVSYSLQSNVPFR